MAECFAYVRQLILIIDISFGLDNLITCKENVMNVEILIILQFIRKVMIGNIVDMKSH